MVFLTKQVTDSENHLTPRFKVGREKRIEIWYYRKKKKFKEQHMHSHSSKVFGCLERKQNLSSLLQR